MLGFKHSLRNNAIDQINEAVALNQSELQKLNGTTGEARIDILRRLIRDGKSLELRKGGNTIVTDIEDALQKLNQFETTPSNISFVCGDVKYLVEELQEQVQVLKTLLEMNVTKL